MLIVISPAKTLDYDTPPRTDTYTTPGFLDHSQELISTLKQYSALDLSELMHISAKLGELNFERNHSWATPFTPDNAKQAIFAFKGDVYTGLNIDGFTDKQVEYAQEHLRMLSGLYGLLRPLDLMQPYRLEMGTKLDNDRGKNLYEFWGSTITDAINDELKSHKSKVLINLASNEYFKSVKPKELDGRLITPVFKEFKGGKYKVVGIYAKKARGLMSAYILKKRISNPQKIKDFSDEGYSYNEELSTENEWVFTRVQP